MATKKVKSKEINVSKVETVSIIVPVFNHEDTVAEALESILMQEIPFKIRIYCLDDASTDGSGEILKTYKKKYPHQIEINTSATNQGSGKKSHYHNRPNVKGKYWCILEGDDYWISKDKLAKQIEFLDGNDDFVGCSSNTLVRDETTGKESIIQPSCDSWNLLDLLLLQWKYAFYVHTSSIVWRNIYVNTGFYLPPAFKKEFATGDVILQHMMLSMGGKMKNIPEVMSCYRLTGKGVWSKFSEQERAIANIELKKKINQSLTFKIKVIVFLHRYLKPLKLMLKSIPGPLNG